MISSIQAKLVEFAVLLPIFLAQPALAQRSPEATVGKSLEVLSEITRNPKTGMPRLVMRKAAGIAIIPDMFKASFIFGARFGRGVLVVSRRTARGAIRSSSTWWAAASEPRPAPSPRTWCSSSRPRRGWIDSSRGRARSPWGSTWAPPGPPASTSRRARTRGSRPRSSPIPTPAASSRASRPRGGRSRSTGGPTRCITASPWPRRDPGHQQHPGRSRIDDPPPADAGREDGLARADRTYDARRGSLGAFLTTLTRSRAIDRLRSRGRRLRILRASWRSAPSPDLPPAPVDRIATRESSERVRGAIAELPANERRALEMVYYQGLTQTEIAAALDAPLGTVKSWCRRGLLGLRAALADLVE